MLVTSYLHETTIENMIAANYKSSHSKHKTATKLYQGIRSPFNFPTYCTGSKIPLDVQMYSLKIINKSSTLAEELKCLIS